MVSSFLEQKHAAADDGVKVSYAGVEVCAVAQGRLAQFLDPSA